VDFSVVLASFEGKELYFNPSYWLLRYDEVWGG